MKNIKIKHLIISIIIIISFIILDQISKYIIEKNMDLGQSIMVIEDFFYITSHRNTGAAWGIASGKLWMLISITIVALGIFIYLIKYIDFKSLTVFSISLSLIISGTIGNFIDRVFKNGKVTDFLDFYIFKYDFPIFNVADICLTIGVSLLMIDILFGKTGKLWTK